MLHRCSCFSFSPTWPACNPPHCRRFSCFRYTPGNLCKSYTSETATGAWCPQSGFVSVYDSLYKNLSKETVRLIASMVHVPNSDLMMDIEKQSNGSDCVVLAIAYAFYIFSGLNPCSVRFDHSKIRPYLITCLENCQVSGFPVFGQREECPEKGKDCGAPLFVSHARRR